MHEGSDIEQCRLGAAAGMATQLPSVPGITAPTRNGNPCGVTSVGGTRTRSSPVGDPQRDGHRGVPATPGERR